MILSVDFDGVLHSDGNEATHFSCSCTPALRELLHRHPEVLVVFSTGGVLSVRWSSFASSSYRRYAVDAAQRRHAIVVHAWRLPLLPREPETGLMYYDVAQISALIRRVAA